LAWQTPAAVDTNAVTQAAAPAAVAASATPPDVRSAAPAQLPSAREAAASAPVLAILAGSQTAAAGQPAATGVQAGDGVQVRALQDTWLQVTDSSGKALVARTLAAGETASFNAGWPLRLRVGNVQGTEVLYRGSAIDLKAMTRDNTVSLTLPPGASQPAAMASNPGPAAKP
jgi:cytoskeleton protein RodZ